MTCPTTLTVSIVSHGQGHLIAPLLDDLAAPGWHGDLTVTIVVTLNIPEDEGWLQRPLPHRLRIRRNEKVAGFGANHNAALREVEGDLFAVVNPDIRLDAFDLNILRSGLAGATPGVCGPLVRAPGGGIEDSARRFPTLRRLVGRRLSRTRRPDYLPTDLAVDVDWVAGMFMLFAAEAYRQVGGFDERYFMYLEDVEICRHLQAQGRSVRWVGGTAVVHDAARASGRSLRHARWHLTSLMRFLLLPRRR